MSMDLVRLMEAEYKKAAQLNRNPRVPSVITSPNMPLRKAPTLLTSSPTRFANSIFASYDGQKPEVMTVQKVAASYDLVAADETAFLTGRQWTTEIYGLTIDILAPQGVAIPDLAFTASGFNYYGDPITVGVNTAALPADSNTRQKATVAIFPFVVYNSAALFVPFAFRPLLGAGAPAPLLANVLVAFTAGAAPPTGSTVIYNLLTRGTPEVDGLMAWKLGRDDRTDARALRSVRALGIEK